MLLQRLEDRAAASRAGLPRPVSSRACGSRWGRTGRPSAAAALSACLRRADREALQPWQGNRRTEAAQHRPPSDSPRLAHRLLPGSTPFLERVASDDFQDERRESVFVSRQLAGDSIDGAFVVVFQAAAQGVGQHLLGQAADEIVPATSRGGSPSARQGR